MPLTQTVAIGLGSNIDPEKNLKAAAGMLKKLFPDIRFSSVYSSAPMHVEDQPAFLNAAATFTSDSSAEEISATLRSIEESLGKKPTKRFGPRTIDLDLLLIDQYILPDEVSWKRAKEAMDPEDTTLYLPHLRLDERRFVLEPLHELIDAQCAHPILKSTIKQMLEHTNMQICLRNESVILS